MAEAQKQEEWRIWAHRPPSELPSMEYLVQRRGYDRAQMTWVARARLAADVPAVLAAYEQKARGGDAPSKDVADKADKDDLDLPHLDPPNLGSVPPLGSRREDARVKPALRGVRFIDAFFERLAQLREKEPAPVGQGVPRVGRGAPKANFHAREAARALLREEQPSILISDVTATVVYSEAASEAVVRDTVSCLPCPPYHRQRSLLPLPLPPRSFASARALAAARLLLCT